MNTVYSLLFMFGLLTIGLFPIPVVMLAMGLAGAPGAIIYSKGEESANAAVKFAGFWVCALCQTFVAGAYTALVISLLYWLTARRPELATWPLWIAAFCHSGATPAYAMKENPAKPTAQHLSLSIVTIVSFVIFWLVIFAPNLMEYVYGWIPFYGYIPK